MTGKNETLKYVTGKNEILKYETGKNKTLEYVTGKNETIKILTILKISQFLGIFLKYRIHVDFLRLDDTSHAIFK